MSDCAHAEQVTSNYFQGYDRLLDVFHEVGSSLPQFQETAEIFRGSNQIANYLGLFYSEIIEFHYQAMRFFRQTSIALWVCRILTACADVSGAGWKMLFECLWPKYEDIFDIIGKNIEKHRRLIGGEVGIQMIKESRKARDEALKRHQEERDSKELDRLERDIPPHDYKPLLEKVQRGHYAETGEWIFSDPLFRSWLNAETSEAKQRLLWLAGVPGAGNPFVRTDRLITDHHTQAKLSSVIQFCSISRKWRKPMNQYIFSMLFRPMMTPAETQRRP